MRESKTLVLVAVVRVGNRWLGIRQALLPRKSILLRTSKATVNAAQAVIVLSARS